MTATAFVLLSGGLDSTTALYLAKSQFPSVVALSADYGQRHSKEVECAAWFTKELALPHFVLDLRSVIPKTMLTDKTQPIPNVTYADIKGKSPAYVPFRNGLLISAATAFAVGWLEHHPTADIETHAVYFGAHTEDAQNQAYADCTAEFIGAMANAVSVGTYGHVRLHTPFQWLTKDEIVLMGAKMGIPYEKTFSCYKGGQIHCGECPTCYARKAAFKRAEVTDPTIYAV